MLEIISMGTTREDSTNSGYPGCFSQVQAAEKSNVIGRQYLYTNQSFSRVCLMSSHFQNRQTANQISSENTEQKHMHRSIV
jgi:hypothetical protein